jgi:hypothetical protein
MKSLPELTEIETDQLLLKPFFADLESMDPELAIDALNAVKSGQLLIMDAQSGILAIDAFKAIQSGRLLITNTKLGLTMSLYAFSVKIRMVTSNRDPQEEASRDDIDIRDNYTEAEIDKKITEIKIQQEIYTQLVNAISVDSNNEKSRDGVALLNSSAKNSKSFIVIEKPLITIVKLFYTEKIDWLPQENENTVDYLARATKYILDDIDSNKKSENKQQIKDKQDVTKLQIEWLRLLSKAEFAQAENFYKNLIEKPPFNDLYSECELKFDINYKDQFGKNALDYVARYQQHEHVAYIHKEITVTLTAALAKLALHAETLLLATKDLPPTPAQKKNDTPNTPPG